jgi:beta-mannosidase
MDIHSLNGRWEFFKTGDPAGALPATVPGCAHTDLLANARLPDPFYRDQELAQRWVGETDWTYRRTFSADAATLAHDRVLLRCHGLDTLATIRLNGVEIGRTDNMFRRYEFDVKAALHPGENQIEIDLAAPMPYVRRMDAERGAMAGWVEPMRVNSSGWLRKEPCNFGWDWGPKMPTSGVWRDIEIVAYSGARLGPIATHQTHADDAVTLRVTGAVEPLDARALNARIALSRDGREVVALTVPVESSGYQAEFAVPAPELWWPHGMGAQPLYDLTVTLFDGETPLDSAQQRLGLRTLALQRPRDEDGQAEAFYFTCNGVAFFAKGANWISPTPYPGQTTRAEYERWIQTTVAANMNMLRVWGGGTYECDDFYDLCDQYGVTVWQDFMFACGTYPSYDAAFMDNVRAEAVDNVLRVRHHACIALWCGNNEIEQGLPTSPGWLDSMTWDDYRRLFDGLLAEVCADLAPQTAYWPGSPHTPLGDRNDANDPNSGDTHLWAVWHGRQPFEWYRTRPDRFVSEFGFQSFPQPSIIAEFTAPDDRNITSYVMEHHQRSAIGNATIIAYMLEWYRLPTGFESMVWLSQILQGMAMKYAVEHWRRNMPRTMGTLYWQLNDMWPAPSWASVDWRGNWKALHHMARRFYAPLLISGLEDLAAQTVGVHLTSDLGESRPVIVRWAVSRADGEEIARGEQATASPVRASAAVQTLDLAPHIAEYGVRDLLIWLELYGDDGEAHISENLVTLARPKHIALRDPQIAVEVGEAAEAGEERFTVTLTAQHPALYAWLTVEGASAEASATFSDNFVDLRPGRPHTVTVSAPGFADAASFAAALRVQSLFDTYQ